MSLNVGQKSARAKKGARRWRVGEKVLSSNGWGRESVGEIVGFENWCGHVMVFVQFEDQPRPRWNYLERIKPAA